MKRIASILLILVFALNLGLISSEAATKKKKKSTKRVPKKRRVSYPRYSWPKGSRPVFPSFNGGENPALQAKPATAETETMKPIVKKPIQDNTNKGFFMPTTGLGGGALLIGLNYQKPWQEGIDLSLRGSLGVGNGYTVMAAGISSQFNFKEDLYVGAGIDLANYSQPVSNVFGISGNIAQGTRLGLAISAGKFINKWNLEVGYSSALGLTARAGYKF
ncbi:MAG: hypothetical protein WCV91_03450 [Candidatus Margulisiibacteriota bacterium]